MGLLLWATPVISTEIEGQTWIYLAMRRSGRSLVLLGKYLTAVLWSVSAALVSTSMCAIVMGPAGGWKLWWVICVLSVLSCIAHAALYVLIGTLFFRRTMVTAVFYTMVVRVRLVVGARGREQVDDQLSLAWFVGPVDGLGGRSQRGRECVWKRTHFGASVGAWDPVGLATGRGSDPLDHRRASDSTRRLVGFQVVPRTMDFQVRRLSVSMDRRTWKSIVRQKTDLEVHRTARRRTWKSIVRLHDGLGSRLLDYNLGTGRLGAWLIMRA